MKMRLSLLGLILGLAFFASACERVTIGNIENNTARYLNRQVGIIGTVRDSYGLNIPFSPVRGGIYKVDDGTGSIWVITQNSVPNKGARIGVKGAVQNGLSFNGRNYGLGMIESDRRIR
ncbi:MAG: hypothetical protein H7Z37_15225 [Pyrinomonadaceae bacterium]|nr:hypothetical protein [Pyrinomonadaceae bacterium]